ncbi:mesoderm induction early response protein 2-like isoform X1 [Astyanax mexicanus]|uniref:Mesoderm induction early response protein 2-like isoform X1 n=1 Tax=Astyanax mexicanus TaxID=7994 RepID=A0A8T2L550_ASTMX|nr:mesoderm induction early response protein 2-like isoform X1 [Astyanax mexicanus]
MGSTDRRQGLAQVLCLGYAAPLELSPQTSTHLEEQQNILGAWKSQPEKMAARPHSGGEMPLEELLALYGYDMSNPVLQQHRQPSETAATLPETSINKIAKGLFSGGEDEDTRSSADDLKTLVTSHSSDLLRCHLIDKDTAVSSSDEDSDSNIPPNDGRKDIMVGPQYQAVIPPLGSYTCYDKAYDGEDQLLWTPDVMSSTAVEEFLLHVQRQAGQDGAVDTLTSGEQVKDNEQALYELVKCNFNSEEALRRLRFNVKVFSEELCAWSEEECRNFEHGYRVHGKNFHLIQGNKVRTRSVGECVEYYYMWKKSERHEYFTQQSTKLGRRKYTLQSGNMEDVEADGDHSEVDGSSLKIRPPSPPPVLQVEQTGAELEIRALELCAGPHSSLQREPLYGSFSPLLPLQELQRPVLDCLGPDSLAASPSSQLYTSPRLHQQESQEPDLLGARLFQPQLGSLSEDSLPSGSQSRTSRRLQTDFSLSSTPVSHAAFAPSVTVPDFGAVGGFLCTSSALCTPSLQPHSLMQ